MNTPTFSRGYLYDTSLSRKCPMFRACLGSHKCTSFNRHNSACISCESRVSPPSTDLGGAVKDPAIGKDYPGTIRALEAYLHASYFNPEAMQTMDMPSKEDLDTIRENNPIIHEYGGDEVINVNKEAWDKFQAFKTSEF